MRDKYPDDCPKRDDCLERFGGQDSLCPSTKTEIGRHLDTTPLRPAELLCHNALAIVARKPCADPFKERFKSADERLDGTLALPSSEVYDGVRKNGFEEIANDLEKIRTDPDIFSKGRLKYHALASRLGIFLPAFRERAFGQDVSSETVATTHARLVEWLAEFDNHYTRAIPKNDHGSRSIINSVKAESEVMALRTRIGGMTFPATEREEASHARGENNHDFYELDGRSRKIPIQVKTSKKAGGYTGVVTIVHHDILRALRETHTFNDLKQQSITAMLQREQLLGRGKEPETTHWLDLGSMYVTSRIDAFDDHRLA